MHGRRGLTDAGGPYSICLGTPISPLGDNLISARVPCGSSSSVLPSLSSSEHAASRQGFHHGPLDAGHGTPDAGCGNQNGYGVHIVIVVVVVVAAHVEVSAAVGDSSRW